MTKEEFIASYLNKSRRLKNHNLPYGMEYLSLVAQVEEDAEKKYKSYLKKQQNIICPKCGGDSWKFNAVKTTIKYCKCGHDF